MGRRNQPLLDAASRPAPTDRPDDRTDDEVLATVRRKLLIGVLALSAPLIAIALSWSAMQSKRAELAATLPPGVSFESPVIGAPGQTVSDRLAELGAELKNKQLFDSEGRPIEIRRGPAPPVDPAEGEPRERIVIEVADAPQG